MRLLLLVAGLLAATALPIGHEDETHSLHNEVRGFKHSLQEAQTSAHPDAVSQVLSDDMDEEFDEQRALENLENDNEKVGGDEPELGETQGKFDSLTPAPPVVDIDDAEEQEKLDKLSKQADQAKHLEEKEEKQFDKMGKDIAAQAQVKKQAKEVAKAAKDALSIAGTAPDQDKELGDPLSTGTFIASVTNDGDDERLKKLDAMAAKLKSSERKTEKNMQDIEQSYVKNRENAKKVKDEVDSFKKTADEANKLADEDDPSNELGESSSDMEDEINKLEELHKDVTEHIDADEMHSMVRKSNAVIQKFANSALDVINNIQ